MENEQNRNIISPTTKRPVDVDVKPFSMMAPSDLPSAMYTRFQVWKKPYFMNQVNGDHSGTNEAATSSQTNTYFQPLDQANTSYDDDDDHSNENTQNLLLPLFTKKNLSSNGDATSKEASNKDLEKDVGDDHEVQARNARNKESKNYNIDPKKLKRIISNRASAQKSRLKKVQYVIEMERKAKALEAEVSFLSPQVEMCKNHQRLLLMEQKSLKEKMSIYNKNRLLKEAEIEGRKIELNRLNQIQMKLRQVENNSNQAAHRRTHTWDGTAKSMDHHQRFGNLGLYQHGMGHMANYMNQNQDFGEGWKRLGPFSMMNQPEYRWMPTPGLRQNSGKPNSNFQPASSSREI